MLAVADARGDVMRASVTSRWKETSNHFSLISNGLTTTKRLWDWRKKRFCWFLFVWLVESRVLCKGILWTSAAVAEALELSQEIKQLSFQLRIRNTGIWLWTSHMEELPAPTPPPPRLHPNVSVLLLIWILSFCESYFVPLCISYEAPIWGCLFSMDKNAYGGVVHFENEISSLECIQRNYQQIILFCFDWHFTPGPN